MKPLKGRPHECERKCVALPKHVRIRVRVRFLGLGLGLEMFLPRYPTQGNPNPRLEMFLPKHAPLQSGPKRSASSSRSACSG